MQSFRLVAQCRFVSRGEGLTYIRKTDPVPTRGRLGHIGGAVADKPFISHFVHK